MTKYSVLMVAILCPLMLLAPTVLGSRVLQSSSPVIPTAVFNLTEFQRLRLASSNNNNNNNSYRFRVPHEVCLPGSRSKTVRAMRCETCIHANGTMAPRDPFSRCYKQAKADLWGNDFTKWTNVRSYERCCELCKLDRRCYAFNYGARSCWLKHRADNWRVTSWSDAGYLG
jgi:hypothetical protein